MGHFEILIAFYICFLFLLRGDCLSFLYCVLLLCFGLLSPFGLNTFFVDGIILVVALFTGIRFLIQTPLICQTTREQSGIWSLSLKVGKRNGLQTGEL